LLRRQSRPVESVLREAYCDIRTIFAIWQPKNSVI
jgi:hypothetical protein